EGQRLALTATRSPGRARPQAASESRSPFRSRAPPRHRATRAHVSRATSRSERATTTTAPSATNPTTKGTALAPAALRGTARHGRRAPTAAGTASGVAALVLLGALAEKLGRLVEGGRDFATGQITVSGSGTGAVTGMTRGGLLSREQLAALGAVPGVALVAPVVMFPVSDAPATLPFAPAESLLVESEPLLRRLAMVPGSSLLPIATAAAVFWADDADPEAVAARIRERVDHLSVVSPADAAKQLDRSLVVLNSVIVG